MSPPHNLPFAALGAALLWFGWFGFNAGSALGANGLAAAALVTTHTAAAMAGLTWSLLDWLYHGKPTMLGMITGAVAGLVAITPAAGFVTPVGAICIGALAAALCYAAVTFVKAKLGYDDTLDAFGVHGVGGFVGAIATGIWATKSVNPLGADGLLYGNPLQFWIQTKAAVITLVYSLVVTVVLYKLVDWVLKMRVDEHAERVGLDLTQHREVGYTLVD
jgi:Amt family ammonium transporter